MRVDANKRKWARARITLIWVEQERSYTQHQIHFVRASHSFSFYFSPFYKPRLCRLLLDDCISSSNPWSVSIRTQRKWEKSVSDERTTSSNRWHGLLLIASVEYEWELLPSISLQRRPAKNRFDCFVRSVDFWRGTHWMKMIDGWKNTENSLCDINHSLFNSLMHFHDFHALSFPISFARHLCVYACEW